MSHLELMELLYRQRAQALESWRANAEKMIEDAGGIENMEAEYERVKHLFMDSPEDEDGFRAPIEVEAGK